MISAIGSFVARAFRHTCPDPYVIVILLTVLTFALGLAWGSFPSLPADAPRSLSLHAALLFDAWLGPRGLWFFLTFSMQMALILVTGHALASTRPVQSLVDRLASIPKTPRSAAALIALVAVLTGIVHWGLSLIVGALLAREVGRSLHIRGIRAHYPLLVAAGYMGLLVFHGGLSGSAPLSVTTPANASKVLEPAVVEQLNGGIGLERTLFSPLNFFVTGGLILIIPLLLLLLTPRRDADFQPIDQFDVKPRFDPAPVTLRSATLPERMDGSRLIAWALALPMLLAAFRGCYNLGVASAASSGLDPAAHSALRITLLGFKSVGLNEINMLMFAAGMMLHASPRQYMAAAEDGASGCAGIIIQFPLYGGIMIMMSTAGLDRQIADWFVSIGSPATLPALTFFSACVIGLFVASGGGQWGIQGPIALRTAFAENVLPEKMVMAVSYGDQVPNMLQPFWALPLLAITGVRARDIVGYTTVVMIVAFVWITIGLRFL